MGTKLRRGFRVESEEYAEEYRLELGLERHASLSPKVLCEHLLIPVYDLSTFPGVSSIEKIFFAGPGNSLFSATTIPLGTSRVIIHNDYQHPNRQFSNIMHEVAHIILGHPPKPPLIGESCRNYDANAELEANQLGFTLLVPKIAALFAVEGFSSLAKAAAYYGVSLKLLTHRIQVTDARRWAINRARKRA